MASFTEQADQVGYGILLGKKFFMTLVGSDVKNKHPNTPAMEEAAAYINAWIFSGFSYSSLWDRYVHIIKSGLV